MKENPKKHKKSKFEKHWGSWAKGYLKLAEQGFLYFKNQKKIGRKSFFKKSKKIYSLENGSMIIASIWNIKHGLELIIKGLGITLDKKYWYAHDLDFLLKDLDNKLKDHCLKKHIDFLKSITRKYYKCNFTSKTLFIDKKNDFFKYPESDKFSLNYSFVHDLKRKDIGQFLKDIHNLKRIYDLIENQPQWFIKSKEWGLSKKDIEKQIMKIPTMKNSGLKK